MTDFGLTDEGFIAPRSTDLLDQIREEYEERTGLTIDWAHDTFLGTLTEVIAEVMGRQSEALQAIADSRDPDNATGAQLDALASIVGIDRIDAEFSAVDLTLGGEPGTEIPQDSEVEHPDGTLWYTQDDVTLDSAGEAVVEARPDETGPIEAVASTDWEINNPVDGWDTVESTEDATPGRNQESDPELRLRRQQSLQIIGAGAIGALRSNILELGGVSAAVVIDNDTPDPVTIAGLDLTPKSFAVIVYPALTADQSEALAEEIYRRAPAGIESIGDQSAGVEAGDGFTKTVRWFIAQEIPVGVDVEYTGDSGLEGEIEEAIADYFDGRDVGDPVRILQILGAISGIDGVESATVELDGGTDDVIVEITEIAVVDSVQVVEV